MRIPEHIIDQIRTNADIVEVIGMHVSLVKKGRSYLGLCPFHKEKTPSFNVSREKGFYKCFGCGRSGDSIKFLQEFLHLDFLESVKQLAAQLNIAIPEDDVEDPSGEPARRDAARKALRAAEEFYQAVLASSDGMPAHAFFEKRKFLPDTITQFRLGAAPASWDALLSKLTSSGFTREQLEDAGLVIIRDDGKEYDRFRGRAMFPLHDHQGRTVGFSARRLTDDPESPKYINSPQSIVFDKSRVLYGLDLARRDIADKHLAYFVEGQADVIAMHQGGFINTVATSGTSLTADHLALVKRYTDTVVLVFDADSAGQQAMTRAIELGLGAGLSIRCVVLPSGEDPDSLLRGEGAHAMQDLLDGAEPWMTFQVNQFRKQGVLTDSAGQSTAIRTMLNWIRTVPDKIQHPFLVRDLAQRFDIAEELLLQQLSKTTLPTHKQALPAVAATSARQTVPTATRPSPLPLPLPVLHPAERELLRIAISVEHGLTDLIHVFQVQADQFITVVARTLYGRICEASEESPDVTYYLLHEAGLDEPSMAIVRDLISSTQLPSGQWRRFDVDIPALETQRLISNALDQLKRFSLDAEIQGIRRMMQSENGLDEQRKILHKLDSLLQERAALIQRIERSPNTTTWHDADSASVS